MTTALDNALKERARIIARANAADRADLEELCQDPTHGDLLRKFIKTLGHFRAGHADRMVEYVRREVDSWLCFASDDISYAALKATGAHIQRIRINAGLPVFDDPLPGEEDDVFQICKRMIRP